MQPRSPGHGPGPDLRRRRPQGVGGLLGLASLDTAQTPPTAPHAHAKLGHDRPEGGQLGLELLRPALEVDVAAASRTAGWQGRIENLVRMHRHGPMAMATVGLALLATRPSGLVDRFALRERRRLALRRTACLLQQLLQLGHASVLVRQCRAQFLHN